MVTAEQGVWSQNNCVGFLPGVQYLHVICLVSGKDWVSGIWTIWPRLDFYCTSKMFLSFWRWISIASIVPHLRGLRRDCIFVSLSSVKATTKRKVGHSLGPGWAMWYQMHIKQGVKKVMVLGIRVQICVTWYLVQGSGSRRYMVTHVKGLRGCKLCDEHNTN